MAKVISINSKTMDLDKIESEVQKESKPKKNKKTKTRCVHRSKLS